MRARIGLGIGWVAQAAVVAGLGAALPAGGCGDDAAAPEPPIVDVELGGLAELRFAVVGDTRPTNEDDTASYPTAIITRIWSDVEAEAPHPPFAISTGDYMNASPGGAEQDRQLDLYLGARARYAGPVFAAMGNHECTGSTVSNCGVGAPDGVTHNYASFVDRMVRPVGVDRPYYTVHAHAADDTWTAKLIVIAANAWSDEQAAWLDAALGEATTYTFVVRHEPTIATAVGGVVASNAILARHPVTLRIVGHTHTYARYPDSHEVVIGNGGAPLSSAIDYGYAILARRADGAIELTAYDYATRAVIDRFAVTADGGAAAP